MGEGWIKIHRSIMDHWISDDPRKQKWWLAVLLGVNYSDGKMNFGNKLITVRRGSSTKSLRAWGEVFGCGTKAVTNFFDLLESDQMISRETIRIGKHSTTLIKVINYEKYQGKLETPKETSKEKPEEIQRESIEQHERHTIKEGNKNKNLKKEEEEEDVYHDIENLKVKYLKNKRLCNSIIKEQKIKNQDYLKFLLEEFNKHLNQLGQHSKSWKDYTSHFLYWMRKKKNSNMNFKKENNEKRSSKNGEARIGRTTNEDFHRTINPEKWTINKY
ncbi:MAG: hypothetical protein ABGW76_04925 [Mesonia sp.]|uniref:DUF7833 domain-containing protein n=1 Tax=Mesonia sp. TaxID=1960830 RepID=UPI0032429BFB